MWGQRGLTAQRDEVRPHFRGIPRRSPVNFSNNLDTFEVTCCAYSRWGWLPRKMISYFLLLIVAYIHVALMLYLLAFRREWIKEDWIFVDHSNKVVGMVFALQMCAFSGLGFVLCPLLNNWENYRTSTEYTNSLIIKQVFVEFVNQFAIFFYIAFFKGAVEGCVVYTSEGEQVVRPTVEVKSVDNIDGLMCLDELQDAVKIVLMGMAAMNVAEITVPAWVIPALRKIGKFRRSDSSWSSSSRGMGQHRSSSSVGVPFGEGDEGFSAMAHLVQSMLDKEQYSGVEISGTSNDYIELVVLFGHISLFSVIFPFAPLVVMVLIVIEIRVDGHKLFYTVRRPLPKDAETIGAWHTVFQFITWTSVLTNSMIVVFSLAVFDSPLFSGTGSNGERGTMASASRWLICVCGILILALFKVSIYLGVPEVPGNLRVLLAHHANVCELLSNNNLDLKPRRVSFSDLDTTIYGKSSGELSSGMVAEAARHAQDPRQP